MKRGTNEDTTKRLKQGEKPGDRRKGARTQERDLKKTQTQGED